MNNMFRVFNFRVIYLLILSATCVMISQPVFADEDHEEEGEEGFVAISMEDAQLEGVTLVEVGKATIRKTLLLHGETALNADAVVHVVPRFPGTVTKVGKHLGEPVKKGEVLAVVESNESLAPYDISSDLDGLVIAKDVARGEFVRDEDKIFTVANLDRIWVNAAIHARDLKRVTVGREVEIHARSLDLTYNGKIDYIRPTLSEATQTALARIIIPNSNRDWFPGMFVTVKVTLGAEEVPLAVPDRAIVLLENNQSVFIKSKAEDGSEGFEVREVVAGRTDGTTTEILRGLQEGEIVATGRTFILKADLGKSAAEDND